MVLDERRKIPALRRRQTRAGSKYEPRLVWRRARSAAVRAWSWARVGRPDGAGRGAICSRCRGAGPRRTLDLAWRQQARLPRDSDAFVPEGYAAGHFGAGAVTGRSHSRRRSPNEGSRERPAGAVGAYRPRCCRRRRLRPRQYDRPPSRRSGVYPRPAGKAFVDFQNDVDRRTSRSRTRRATSRSSI